METYEIIVKNDSDVLKVKLPVDVVEKIKEMSTLKDSDFKKSANEQIMKALISSLDSILYTFDNLKPHSETSIDTNAGEVISEKTENGKEE